MDELTLYKNEIEQVARELHYPEEVINKIYEAKSEIAIDRVMKTARLQTK